jgi:acyl-CoA thioesterase FadM
VGVTAASPAATALHDEGYRFVVPIDPEPTDFDAQGHLNNAAIVRIFNDIRVGYVQQRVGHEWPAYLRAERVVVVARELHVLYESEGLPSDRYVGAMRYVRREGRAAIIEQRLVEARSARAIARAWVVQLLARDGSTVAFPDFYFALVAGIEGREIERLPSVRRAWGPPS